MKQSRVGFTIVELLIVIVVIGILAAITIVAYNSVQNRARAAAVTSGLSQAAKRLAAFAVDGNGYPASLAAVDISNSSSISYQYTYNNSATPATYCMTATTGPTSYMISSTATQPTAGGCNGHGQGGVDPITNLATNPTFESNTTGWSTGGYGGAGVGTTSRVAGLGPTGGAGMRSTWTTAATSAGHQSATLFSAVESGKTYTMSVWLRASATNTTGVVRAQIGAAVIQGSYVTLPANTWVRATHTFTAPSSATNGVLAGRIDNLAGTPNGFTFDVANFMLTEGSTAYSYADGNSANWAWTSTVNNSTSTGPPL